MPEAIPPPVAYGWFTPLQHAAMLRVIGTPDGFVRVAELYDTVRQRVDALRERSLTSAEIIRDVMAETRADHPEIEATDFLAITRSMLSAIFEELDSAGD
jgi:hypothetical protein